MVRIKYITNVRIPTPRALGYAVMKMCQEFSSFGAEVELIIPKKQNNENIDDPFVYYGIQKNFSITKINSIDLLGSSIKFGLLFYWLDVVSFLVSLFFKKDLVEEGDVVYTRDYLVAFIFSKKRFVCLEVHNISKNFLFKYSIRRVDLLFVLNTNIKRELVNLGVKEEKIFISPSGVDISFFDLDVTKESARKKLNLNNSKLVVYTGHLYSWKGVDTLAETAKLMPEINFLFVGGVEPELSFFSKKYAEYKNIIIRPFEARSRMPYYLKSADVLVVPNSAKAIVSSEYTSPLKLLEYMVSKRPIVASNLPSLREILNEDNCIFADPDNPKSFKLSIDNILSNDVLAKKISDKARIDVDFYSWSKRAERILTIIKNNDK